VVVVLSVVALPIGAGAVVVLSRAARRCEVTERAGGLAADARTRLPRAIATPTARLLDGAGIELDPATAVAAWGGGCVASVLLAISIASSCVPVALAVAVIGPPIALRLLRGRRDRRLVGALPELLDVVGAGLRTGSTVGVALDDVAHVPAPLRADVTRIRARATLGAPLPDALAAWVRDRDLPAVRACAGALATAVELGGAAAEALAALASSLRDRTAVAAEARALSTQARWSAVVVGGAPLLYLAVMSATDQRSVAILFADPIGRVCLVAGLSLLAAGAWVMHRMLRDDR
jgi:tight adherence protein B